MSNHKSLIFFNKEGDYLNFNYNNSSERFEGDLMFHENSSETFKSIGLYMFERIPSFEFDSPGELTLDKFQLFNEFGVNIYGSKYSNQQIDRIEPVNINSNFYSKWIYGIDFEKKFPIGSHILFDFPIMEFSNSNQVYIVIGTKKNAIIVLSLMDNATFESTYNLVYIDPNTYLNKSISGLNIIGINNYIDSTYNNNLSNWSEPSFYDKYYIDRKLNLINTNKNKNLDQPIYEEKTVIIDNINLTDTIYYKYDVSSIPSNSKLIIELITRSDLPLIYNGFIDISSNKIQFISTYPTILKPGSTFKIAGSTNNLGFYNVDSVQTFFGNTQTILYATQSQVLWNNIIYECILSYTHSATSSITPNDSTYWVKSNYIPVIETLIPETLLNSQIYLSTDHVYFEQDYVTSSNITLASAASKYSDDFKLFNIDLYFKSGKIKADLIYPTKYAEVNFYHTQVGPTYSIGSTIGNYERIVSVDNELVTELNKNLSSNFKYNIVFTDIDEFGIILNINGMIYQEEIEWIYSGSTIDMERTIDRTLRNWLTRSFVTLYTLGITAELQYIGTSTSIFYNAIVLRTQYPNVPLNFNVQVGTTANYYIEHSTVLFNELSNYLSIVINDNSYDIATTFITPQIPDITTTLNNWIDLHSLVLLEYNILVSSINNLLIFNIKEQNQRLDYIIKIGKSTLPGLDGYKITKKIKGNKGMLITSNEVIISASSSNSFENAGFATGMLFSVNNTIYPYDNQEYNILYLNDNRLNLSYQGPFWGLTDSICNSSAFITIAFNIGFGQTGCSSSFGLTSQLGGSFDTLPLGDFDPSMFSLSYNANTYSVNTYNLMSFTGSSNLIDINYIQLSNSLYALGDSITVFDAFLGEYLTSVVLPGNTQSIKLEFNTVNNYLYSLSENNIYIIDPLLNILISTIGLSFSAYDLKINQNNGDIYVTYGNSARIDIWNSLNSLSTTIISGVPSTTHKMTYNSFENDMYITTGDGLTVLRIDGSTRTIQTSYIISGLTHSIYYEPVNESVYVYGSNLYKIDNSIVTSISGISTQLFNDIIFNNLTGEMNISDTSTEFIGLDLNTDVSNTLTFLGNYGYLAINQYDGDIYLSSQLSNVILVVDATNGSIKSTIAMSYQTGVMVYNPERRSIWTIQPSANSIIEVEVTLSSIISIIPIVSEQITENQYGTLDPNYIEKNELWLKTREYIRRPRENFESDTQVKFYWKWLYDNAPEIFIYDFSGNQLSSTGSYTYIGEKPLNKVFLNRNPNVDINKVSISEAQQTIFNKVEFTLDYINSQEDISITPEPMELFLGFNSIEEGSVRSILQLYKKEDINFTIETTLLNGNIIEFKTYKQGTRTFGYITLSSTSTDVFTSDTLGVDRGLKSGQLLTIFLNDTSNIKNQYKSKNNGKVVKIRDIFSRTIVVDFLISGDKFSKEKSIISNYPTLTKTTYLDVQFKVIDKEIGRFNVYGQTEIEDIRYKTELSNIGKNIGESEIFIFKEYDINEQGIDWIFLNQKRKEMLINKHLIYPFIGSYKSIINAINFWGYNDLELYEYYRNIDTNSPNFLTLFKIEIPDIFDNTVEGWTENDFIKHTLPNEKYEMTNLFNLTYNITDKSGNSLLTYSIEEVIIKLQGLKFWLQKNIIPLTHKILDITGRADFVGTNTIIHKSYDLRIFNINENLTPISSKINEAYLMPINSGSTVYNVVIEPYTQSNYSLPDYYTISVKTYKTYKEWAPFTTYNIGDRISYYGKLYESVINNNKVKNPRKYENIPEWSANYSYETTQITNYHNYYYVFTGLGSTSSTASIVPSLDPSNWRNVTEWKEINYLPVLKINEFRKIDDLLPFNFSIDSNIDPFISIEITSENGYGSVYRDKKNYEIRGLLDISDEIRYIDPIGPFTPITPITNTP